MKPTADIVIGANYGDEGKGTITARLASRHRNQKVINVLSNGGSQRGHSVTMPDKFHIFKHFGSGTPFGAISYFPKDFIINPLQFCRELRKLTNELQMQVPIAIRHWECRWSTPYDMMWNQISCKANWKGTCGMGIWTTICRYYQMGNTPEFDVFCICYDKEKQVRYLKEIRTYYERSQGLEIPSEYAEAWNSDQLIENFIQDCQLMFSKTKSTDGLDFSKYDHVIFENGQGILLTDNHTDDPERTPSCTDSRVLWDYKDQFENVVLHYVTRPYLTRHGSDNFIEQNVDGDIDSSVEINQDNEWQHKFKYAPLDIKQLHKNICNNVYWTMSRYNHHIVLDVTHCDELDREKEFRSVFEGYPKRLSLNFHGSRIVGS